MAEIKTKATNQNVKDFLNAVEPVKKREDGFKLLEIFEKTTGERPVMWRNSMVGFGVYHYKSEKSSQEGDWPLVAFSPRKQNLTLYIMAGNKDNPLLKKLGKHKTSAGSCLYINSLNDVDVNLLPELIKTSYEYTKKINN